MLFLCSHPSTLVTTGIFHHYCFVLLRNQSNREEKRSRHSIRQWESVVIWFAWKTQTVPSQAKSNFFFVTTPAWEVCSGLCLQEDQMSGSSTPSDPTVLAQISSLASFSFSFYHSSSAGWQRRDLTSILSSEYE